jgi:hypothetical protein
VIACIHHLSTIRHKVIIVLNHCRLLDSTLFVIHLHHHHHLRCIQVLEVAQPNSGRDAFSSLLKKQRLVKEFSFLSLFELRLSRDALVRFQ